MFSKKAVKSKPFKLPYPLLSMPKVLLRRTYPMHRIQLRIS